MSAEKSDARQPVWYGRFRAAAYATAVGSLAWTVLIILPFPPFSYLPPIIVGGGPGIWFLLAYLLFVSVGLGGFGVLSGFLHTIEFHENRIISPSVMWPGFALFSFGLILSCGLLAIGGAFGGYASTIGKTSGTSVRDLLSPFVYPITVSALLAVAGAALALYAMVSARGPSH